MKNKKKKVETTTKEEVKVSKKSKKILIISIISVIIIALGITSFFLIKKYTGIDYKLKKHGYTTQEVKTLKSNFKKEELNEILKKDYHKDYIFIIESKQFQKEEYLVYLDELSEGKDKQAILNDHDPVVKDLRSKENYNEEYLNDYLDYLSSDKDKEKVIEYINYLKELEKDSNYKEEYKDQYMEYHYSNEKESSSNVIKYINFKNLIVTNELYKESYLDKYLDYYMKNQGKETDYILKYINFDNDVKNGKNYNKNYHSKYVDYYLKNMSKGIDDIISTINAEEKKKQESTLATTTEKPIDVSQVDREKFKSAKYFIADYLDRYVNYQARNPSKSTDAVIQAVNSNIDYKFYTNMKSTKTSEGYLMLVNKFYTVGSGYVPKLKSVTGGGSMEPTAAAAFEKMVAAAKNDGISLWNVSGYRSYGTQQSLYNNYKKRDGQAKADTYSARPGSSEHQTGLATDICTASSSAHFENTDKYKWLINNSYKYGFILRYPEGKTYITGYKFEPWHYRYVGVEAATYIHNNNITFEEYHAYFVSH